MTRFYAAEQAYMSTAFDRLAVAVAPTFVDGDTVTTICRLVTRSRRTGEVLESPRSQTARVRSDHILSRRRYQFPIAHLYRK